MTHITNPRDIAALALRFGVDVHPGYEGMFTRDSYRDAMPSGTRVVKVMMEHGDSTPVESLGTVLGSMGDHEIGILYFIEWDHSPKKAVAVIAEKIEAVKP